ncbi:MAG TPA: NUDIX domain-containing protein [Metalysinibacillus jejuensis]|uniref:NUDIX domain-containing protein n=1 Tax=Metalysinibacillus jejuensis TaxID=914327 RepID=A0A921T4A9_9BACL|nr:NUDIX domain-containing protein [Metalysinibacillus jejuensis]
MYSFIDVNGLQVDLYLNEQPTKTCGHVLVLVKKDDKWLCTVHKRRGVEFPGGKVELNETSVQAAKREVYEETGVVITQPQWFAYYEVHDTIPFCKTVFIAEVIEERAVPYDEETIGKKWLTKAALFNEPNLSFYMRDEGMQKIIERAEQL